MKEDLREKIKLRLIVFLVCLPVLQVLFLPEIRGLDSDKAQWGIEAANIIQGGRLSLSGVTPYGGVVRIYLIACSFYLFGVNRMALELPFAVLSSLTIVFLFLWARRLFSAAAGFICVLVLSASPWFVIRNIDNWYYFSVSLALLLLFLNRPWAFVTVGIVLGVACYEHQLAVIIGVAAFISWFVCGRKDRAGIRSILLIGAGWLVGFSPRLVYKFFSGIPVYVEPFNNPLPVVGDAYKFIPYFFGLINGTVSYLRSVGCIVCPVIPLNGIFFIGASFLLVASWRKHLYCAVLIFALFLYVLPFAVIKYTAVRYFQCALFGVTLIIGLGLYELSLRYGKTAAVLLAIYCCANIFYVCVDFYIPFARTGGSCCFFRLGNLTEVSHHLVRSDVLYECLDKDVPVVVCPEPFIAHNIRFYDLTQGDFKNITGSIRENYDDFYLVDYAQSKLELEIDPYRFPGYRITRECRGLKNFSVYRFQKRIAR